MNIEIKAEEYTPRRQTYSHVARRLGDRPASRYDEGTYDLQATKHFHFRPLWAPEYEIFDPTRTKVVMQDWYAFNDPRQFYYGTYNMSRQAMSASAERSFETVEKRNLISRVDADWLEKVRSYLVPLRHYEWAADLNSLRVADWGYGTRVTSAAIFAAGDRLGMAQLLTRIGLVLEDGDDAALARSKQTWTDAAEWQPLRQAVEDTLVVMDWYETFVAQFVALDGIILPLIYQTFDDAGLERSALAVSMMCEFMVDWMADSRRWVDALVKVCVDESADNQQTISDWYRTWRDRAVDGALPLAESVLGVGGAAAVDKVRTALDERATNLGLTA